MGRLVLVALSMFVLHCGGAATPDAASDVVLDHEPSSADGAPVDAGLEDSGAAPADSGVVRDGAAIDDTGVTPSDGGALFADAGPLGEPPWVAVTVLTSETCPTLTPCGGSVVGTWDVSGVCVEVPIADAVARCPGARITRADGRARGRVTFEASPMVARRIAQFETQVDLSFPSNLRGGARRVCGSSRRARDGQPGRALYGRRVR